MNISRLNLNLILTSILSVISYIVAGFDKLFIYMILVIVIDYITGILSAIYNKELNSRISIKGIVKKIGYICLVALCVLLDNLFGSEPVIRTLAISLLISSDGISIVENLAQMGIPIPKKVKQVLEQLKKED